MTKPLYFYNGTTFEQVGPTTPQSPIAYQTSAPTGPATGDLWIDSDGDVDTYNRQLTRYYFVATAAQTTITGTDANGLTLAYVAGSEAVYVNGALQVRGQDYTATNGTSVVLTAALAVNDVVEIFAYTAFTVANAYTKTETDGVAAAAPGLRMVVPTSVAVGSGSGSANAAGQVTFSGASTVSIVGCFSSTYDNYKIMYFADISTSGRIQMRLLNNTTPLTTSTYVRSQVSTNGSSAVQDSGTDTIWEMGGYDSSTLSITADFTIVNPFKAQQTLISGIHGNTSPRHLAISQNRQTDSTSFDGFQLRATAGTISGTIQVYGYKD
jgi:hypothetical protein